MNQKETPSTQKVKFQITLEGVALMEENPTECMKTIQQFYESSLKTIIETCLNENELIIDSEKGNYLKSFHLDRTPPQVHQSR